MIEFCPNPICPDERLVRLAAVVGWLVCPNCDLTVRETPTEIEVVIPAADQNSVD